MNIQSDAVLTEGEIAYLTAHPDVLTAALQSNPKDRALLQLSLDILNQTKPVSTGGVTVETTKKPVNTMEFVDFKGGNEYCLEINGLDGKPIVQLIFNQVNTWNNPRQKGEPATNPDKSYIIVQVNRITDIAPDGEQEIEKLKKYLM